MANQQRTVTLPEEVWGEIDSLTMTTPAELTRELVMRGLRAYKAEVAKGMELETKRLVQQKLKQRQGGMAEALITLKAKLGSGDPELLQALATLEQGIAD